MTVRPYINSNFRAKCMCEVMIASIEQHGIVLSALIILIKSPKQSGETYCYTL